jgi:hypothetical protein
MADVLRKVASGVAAAGPRCFRIYKGRGLNPELLLALKWCLVTWMSSAGVMWCGVGSSSGWNNVGGMVGSWKSCWLNDA